MGNTSYLGTLTDEFAFSIIAAVRGADFASCVIIIVHGTENNSATTSYRLTMTPV